MSGYLILKSVDCSVIEISCRMTTNRDCQEPDDDDGCNNKRKLSHLPVMSKVVILIELIKY